MTRLQAVRRQIGAYVSVRDAEEAISAAEARGVDLTLAWPRFALWLLHHELAEWATADSLAVAALYHRVISGNSPTRQEWDHARRNVDAAHYAAAYSADWASAASSAARVAAYAADPAFSSSAAEAAAWAARAFADPVAAYERQAGALVRCIRECDGMRASSGLAHLRAAVSEIGVYVCTGSATRIDSGTASVSERCPRSAESPTLTRVCPRCSRLADSTLDGLPFCRHCGSATKWLREPCEPGGVPVLVGDVSGRQEIARVRSDGIRHPVSRITAECETEPYTPRLCTQHGLTACMCPRRYK